MSRMEVELCTSYDYVTKRKLCNGGYLKSVITADWWYAFNFAPARHERTGFNFQR